MRTIAFALLLALLFISTISNAAVTITFNEVGSDVVATAIGSADISDITLLSSGGFLSLDGAVAGAAFSPFFISALVIGGGSADVYEVPTTTNLFSTGDRILAGASSGGLVGAAEDTILGPQRAIIYVPEGYVSKAPITSSSTFFSETFGTMGLIPGTYVYEWGTANPDSLTVIVQNPNSAPIPTMSVFGLLSMILALGLAAVFLPGPRAKIKI